jgi:Flp pilus assembly protein TadD
MTDTLEPAYELFRRRRFADAESLCRKLVEASPVNAEAIHLLGLVLKEKGDFATGEQLLRRSIELQPRRAEFQLNLANLLRRSGRHKEAKDCYRAAVDLDPRHRLARLGLARLLNELKENADAERECRSLLAADPSDAEAWSALGTALRDQHRFVDSEDAYRKALASRPDYAVASHNLGSLLAQVDRAEEALEELERARRLGVSTREVALNRGHALFKLYRFAEAEQEYLQAIAQEPRDIDAQRSLARLRYMQGDPKFARDIVAAAARFQDAVGLRLMFSEVLRQVGDLPSAESLLRDLLARQGAQPELQSALAGVLREAGRLKEAERLALDAAAERPFHPAIIENLVRVQLMLGRADESIPFIRTQRERLPHDQRWIAYEATASRVLGTALYTELYDYDQLVRCYDVECPTGWSSMAELNEALEKTLTQRHQFATHPFDQSLRNGSQTARSLLADHDAAIRGILDAFAAPLADYAAQIAARGPSTLVAGGRGARPVIDKCWSVQLRREGFHVNHIHPEGWISSAYYIAVPDEVIDPTLKSGWIKFGEPAMPVPGCTPELQIQPRAGQLVLFPSYMWHGTNPIHGPSPRMTIAFDAVGRPPIQS